jgi:hypothetical protein
MGSGSGVLGRERREVARLRDDRGVGGLDDRRARHPVADRRLGRDDEREGGHAVVQAERGPTGTDDQGLERAARELNLADPDLVQLAVDIEAEHEVGTQMTVGLLGRRDAGVGAELADFEARGERQQAGGGVDEREGEVQVGSQELDQRLVEVAR